MMMHVVTLLLLPALCSAKAILGVDLGSLYMKVALVQRGAPLEIVTNLHAKRKTENMILFDESTRFYGADANSLYGRKPEKSPMAVSVLLGRDDEHPSVTVSWISINRDPVALFLRQNLSFCTLQRTNEAQDSSYGTTYVLVSDVIRASSGATSAPKSAWSA